jgi:site-specific DNA-methyltransferase (adenine-specific)
MELNKIHHCDCLEFMRTLPDKCIDLILTDPPYPDYYVEKYKYNPEPILYLDKYKCKQFVFWSAKEDFILDYTAIHIWDKKTGCGSEYERIFERNGDKNYKMFRYYFINSSVAAQMTKDVFLNHPSQKPFKLIENIILNNTKEGDVIFDPFMGTGTTCYVAQELKRNYIGCELDKEYFEIAQERLGYVKQRLF